MTDESPQADAREEKVNEILAEYLLAMDAGMAPDRDAWIADHPEFAEELEEFFSGTEQFERLSESLHASMAAASRVRGGREPREPSLEPTQALGETPNHDRPASPWPAAVQTAVPGRFPPGTVLLDRYHVVSRIGKGGMGEVYRAYDVVLGDWVALKFLPSKAGLEPEALERLLSEVRLARQICHENVCGVYDIGDFHGEPFISMEYVEGEDLAFLLHRVGRLPVEKALSVAEQLCAGLSAAHERGVLHRDLKPSNVMLDREGRVRITDFGLAVAEVESDRRKEIVGTFAYMAPEQWAGEELSARADVYALGLILYEMFTGKKAYADPSRLATGPQERQPPKPPSEHFPGIHPKIEQTILRCLEPDPTNRPSSAAAVARELPPKSDKVWREPLPPKELDRQRSVLRRWKLAVAIGSVVVLASLILNAHLFRHSLPTPLTPEIVSILADPRQDHSDVAGPWCAVWYKREKDGEFHIYGRPEPAKIETRGALLVGRSYNVMRVQGFDDISSDELHEAVVKREYYWILHANEADRFASIYISPPDDRHPLIGTMYLEKQDIHKEDGGLEFSYLIGDWHGYVEDIDKPGEADMRNMDGKLLMFRLDELDKVFGDPGVQKQGLRPPDDPAIKRTRRVHEFLFD